MCSTYSWNCLTPRRASETCELRARLDQQQARHAHTRRRGNAPQRLAMRDCEQRDVEFAAAPVHEPLDIDADSTGRGQQQHTRRASKRCGVQSLLPAPRIPCTLVKNSPSWAVVEAALVTCVTLMRWCGTSSYAHPRLTCVPWPRVASRHPTSGPSSLALRPSRLPGPPSASSAPAATNATW